MIARIIKMILIWTIMIEFQKRSIKFWTKLTKEVGVYHHNLSFSKKSLLMMRTLMIIQLIRELSADFQAHLSSMEVNFRILNRLETTMTTIKTRMKIKWEEITPLISMTFNPSKMKPSKISISSRNKDHLVKIKANLIKIYKTIIILVMIHTTSNLVRVPKPQILYPYSKVDRIRSLTLEKVFQLKSTLQIKRRLKLFNIIKKLTVTIMKCQR